MEIWEYVKDKKNNKVGILYATADQKKVKIGYSKYHPKFDEFKKDIGFDIAKGKALKFPEELFTRYNVPFIVQKKFPKFIERCRRYFKDKELPKWTKKFSE